MIRIHALIWKLLFILLTLAPVASAQDKPAAPFKTLLEKIELADGDTLVFLGDSITHQCLYTQYVEDYFYTRFPKSRIRFHNAGIGGDSTGDALARFDRDVAAYKPKYVTILLGMNDGHYKAFDAEVFAKYRADMQTLLDKVTAIGATPVLMTPTMYDARAVELGRRQQLEKNKDNPKFKQKDLTIADLVRLEYYNSTLAYYGAWLRHQAIERGFGFVDMYSPLNNVTLEARKKDPNFTLIPDAVHPEAAGQLVMASAVLMDVGPKRNLSSISVSEGSSGDVQVKATGGTVSDLKETKDGLEFTFAADALPLVVPEEAQAGAELVKLGHRLSREALDVHFIMPGEYKLLIDGIEVGTYSNVDLERHIELQSNSKTPQYQQALEVAKLNQQRNAEAVKPLRNLWVNQKLYLYTKAALEARPNDEGAKKRLAGYEKILETFDAKLAELEAKAKSFEDNIYQKNQPIARKYQLVRVNK